MAIIEQERQIEISQVGSSNLLTNHGILNLLENIACYHSDLVGYGLKQMDKTHLSWVLLHWKVQVLKRVHYADKVTVKTWAGSHKRFSTLRDFEIYDENRNLICRASSKWTLIDAEKQNIISISDDVINPYEPEEKSVFNENDIAKLNFPVLPASPCYCFKVQRRDIDANHHLHNIFYLDYAYEALPEAVYNLGEFNSIEIMYKTGAKLGDTVNCYYIQDGNVHFVVMKSEDNAKLHAVIRLSF